MYINQSVISSIKNGAVGVMPTDTIFGIVASVYSPESITRVNAIKDRLPNKRYIVLISNFKQLQDLGIFIKESEKKQLTELWQEPVSVDLKCDGRLQYLHPGYSSIAVRMPKPKWLHEILETTGPIVATSANVSGSPTPDNINDIKKQLPALDFYIDGPTGDKPSRLARLSEEGIIEWIPRG